ncbi:MAG: mannitol dehydrogenase family protein [Candidatus Competibacterales bacterium]
MTNSTGTPLERLTDNTVQRLPATVARPAYDRHTKGVGIVHLGVGAFHRAHQAMYTDAALGLEAGDWRIQGVSLRQATVPDQLNPQDGLYCVAVRDGGGQRLQLIGALAHVICEPRQPGATLEALARPATRIISLTVTEKGYCQTNGALDHHHPDVAHDLAQPQSPSPRSVPGLLVAALERRRRGGTPPPTVLCCDNLLHNGDTLGQLVVAFAAAKDAGLARWIQDQVPFPNAMVDRIVPATTEADRQQLAREIGLEDQGLVCCEPFGQWVIEDRFATGRPPWERVGVQLVADVAPFELMKLRLLNGSHSAIAYLGYLAGFATIAEAVAHPHLGVFVERLMAEDITPAVPPPPGVHLADYRRALMARFANPALGHRTWQVAMDGSQKIPQRWTAVLRHAIAHGRPLDRLALALAAWIRYVSGVDEAGRVIDVRDPLADSLAAAAAGGAAQPEATARRFLQLEAVFDPDLARCEPLVQVVARGLTDLYHLGARGALQRLAAHP